MADFKIKYASPASITVTLASLATSATRVAGRESTAIDNSSNLYVDALVSGFIKTGTPTANTQFDVWVYAQHDDGPTYPMIGTSTTTLSGSDAGATFATEANRNSALRLGATIRIPDTTARSYSIAAFSVASLFGGVLPKRWGLWIVHSTGANLDATGGNHEFKYIGIHGQSV